MTRYLLDTHVLLWADSQSEMLSAAARTAITSADSTLFVSYASLWEIMIKHKLGKLDLRLTLEEIIAEQQRVNRIELLPIRLTHIYGMRDLPLHHRDPFDRLLIAQARSEQLAVISADAVFQQYETPLIW